MKLIGISVDGNIETHIPDISGNYATLCRLDGDDPDELVQQKVAPAGTVVDCDDCIAIWKAARKIKPSQIGSA